MKRILSATLLATVAPLVFGAAPAAARQLTIDDVTTLSRVGAPVMSQDGHWLVWAQRETDLAGNKGRYDLWRLDLSKPNAAPTRLVADPDVNENDPQIVGSTVYYSANDAIWAVPVIGGTPKKLTTFKGGFSGFKVAPTADKVLVWADRKPGAPSLEPAMEKVDPNAGEARVYDDHAGFVRHWDTWSDGTRSQLFVLPLTATAATGNGVAIEGSLVGDTPSKPFGGGEELSWSPDGKTVFFALRTGDGMEPRSTNLDIYATAADGASPPVNLTDSNDATDTQPSVSPDGRKLAYLAMRRPGYEADRLVLTVRDLVSGRATSLTERWDRSVESIAWAPDSRSLYVTAEDTLENPLWRVDAASGEVTRLTQRGNVSGVTVGARGVVVAMNSLTAPDDFYHLGTGAPQRLTSVNAAKLAGVDMPTVDYFSFKGANDDTVWGFSMKPAGATAEKVPVAFLVHGGPQGSFNNSWSYRWNPMVWAGHGYGVVSVDFHGSTGYGQAFTDAIRSNWGGWPLEDLQKGLAAATAKYAWLDGDNACAAGGSYGGYMMNWIEGRWPDRFKCIVQHDGVFDARAMAYETEELWFDEWEHGGKAYYEDPAAFEKWNPVNYVDKWKTPQLVITGEKDFRIPYTQGLATFTALQRRGIPSRLMVNPNENHWVLKPRNSRQWYREVLGWMDKWTGKGGATPSN